MKKRLVMGIAATILSTVTAAALAQADGGVHPTFVDRGSFDTLPNLSGLFPSPITQTEGSRTQSAATILPGDAPATIGPLPRVLVGSTPQAAVFDPATRTVYVANSGGTGSPGSVNTLSVVDARTCNARDTAGCAQTPLTVAAGSGPFALALDEATHTIYVTDANSDTVSVINAATCNATDTSWCRQTPATVTVGQGPFGIAVDPATDTVYVANAGGGGGDTVSVINGATCNATNTSGCGQTPATAMVGNFPFNVVVDAAHKTVYVTDAADNTVSMINAATCHAGHTSGCGRPAPTVAVGSFPAPIAVDATTGTVYVGNGNDATVSLIDAATCNATRTAGCAQPPVTLSVPGGPGGLAINETTHTLFVANNSGAGTTTARANTVSIIDAAICNATNTSGCDQHAPTALTGANPGVGNTVDEATNTLYVTTFDNTLQVINGATCNQTVRTGCGQTTPATLAGVNPFSIAINRATHTAYVGDFGGGEGFPFTISVVNTATCNTLDSAGCNPNPPVIPMQFGPYGVAVDQATDTLYATNIFGSNGNPGDTVSVFNGATCNTAVTTGCADTPPTITVGSGPQGLAINKRTHTIYVANGFEQTVSVIDGASCNATNTGGCSQTPPKIPLTGSPSAIAVNEATNTIYVLNPGTPGTVSVIDGTTCNARVSSGCGQVPPTITVGNDAGPTGLAIDQRTDTVYVDNTADNTVSVIDAATCNAKITSGCEQMPPHVAVGRQFYGFVAVDQTRNMIYVSDNLDDTVSIIDGSRCDSTDTSGCAQTPPTVQVGGNPAGLALDHNDHTVYVDDNGFGPVSFLRFEAPQRPSNVTASAQHGQVELVWQPPRDGGLPMIYQIIPRSACSTCAGLSTPPTSGIPATTISGLAPGQTYTFTVKATNARRHRTGLRPLQPRYPITQGWSDCLRRVAA
jgi:YVTN family beta-propeller protein